jgi:hypothetical protein
LCHYTEKESNEFANALLACIEDKQTMAIISPREN